MGPKVKAAAGMGSPWSGGDDGAEDALARALKMAGIDRCGFDPPRPTTAQVTRDALHSDEPEAHAQLEDCYLAELSMAWDDALTTHRPPTATVDQRLLMGLRDDEAPGQQAGEYDIWRAEDDEESPGEAGLKGVPGGELHDLIEECDEAPDVAWGGDEVYRGGGAGTGGLCQLAAGGDGAGLPEFSSGTANLKLARRAPPRSASSLGSRGSTRSAF